MKLTKEGQDKVISILKSLTAEPCILTVGSNISLRVFDPSNLNYYSGYHEKLRISLQRTAEDIASGCGWGIRLSLTNLKIDWYAGGAHCKLTTLKGNDFFDYHIASKLTLDDIEE